MERTVRRWTFVWFPVAAGIGLWGLVIGLLFAGPAKGRTWGTVAIIGLVFGLVITIFWVLGR